MRQAKPCPFCGCTLVRALHYAAMACHPDLDRIFWLWKHENECAGRECRVRHKLMEVQNGNRARNGSGTSSGGSGAA